MKQIIMFHLIVKLISILTQLNSMYFEPNNLTIECLATQCNAITNENFVFEFAFAYSENYLTFNII